MKASSRKILKKIGAGLMLGLSLFNLGAAWNKAEGWNMAKRSKKLRVKEKDRVDAEITVIAEVAEEEAERAIKEINTAEKSYDVEVEKEVSMVQKIYRASAIGVLGIASGIFATSLLFNMPFSLGKGMLSLLPGTPHLATLSLSVDNNKPNAGEDLTVLGSLGSAGDRVDKLKVVIKYNPNFVSFVETDFSEWELKENQIDKDKRELIILSSEENFVPKSFSTKDYFIKLKFKSKEAALGKNVNFSIDQSRSLVVSKDKGISRNILGAADGISVTFSNKFFQTMKCQKAEEKNKTADFWKTFVKGDSSFLRDDYWQRIDDSIGMLCSYDNNYVYLAIVSPKEKVINKLNISLNKKIKTIEKAEYNWSEGDYEFYLYKLFSSDVVNESEIKIILESDFLNKKEWPLEGVGRIIFD